jgi:hypothetical protein
MKKVGRSQMGGLGVNGPAPAEPAAIKAEEHVLKYVTIKRQCDVM